MLNILVSFVTDLESMGADYTHICRYSIAKLHFNDVANDQLLSVDVHFVAVTDDNGELQWKKHKLYPRPRIMF